MAKKIGWYDDTGTVRLGLPMKTLAAFEKALVAATRALFVKDEDGDYPVQVVVIDRTDTGKLHYEPLLHTLRGHAYNRDRLMENLRRAQMNVEMASGDLRRAMGDFEHFEREREKSHEGG